MDVALIVPDIHAPYHDQRALDLVLQVGAYLKPKWLVTLGDFGDYYCTSRHPKNPKRRRDLDFELASNNEVLDCFDAIGATHKTFHSGNHEYNLTKYIWDRAPELNNLVSVEKELRLKERGWKHVPYMDHSVIGKFAFTHELGFSGQNAAYKSLQDFGGCVVVGHNHRLEVSYGGKVRGDRLVGASLGWLGDAKKAEYLHNSKKTSSWQLGFGVIHFESSGVGFLQACPIVNYRTVVNGKQFK